MTVWAGGYIDAGVAMNPRKTIPLLDTCHIKCFFGYLVKIILNSSSVKKERIQEKIFEE